MVPPRSSSFPVTAIGADVAVPVAPASPAARAIRSVMLAAQSRAPSTVSASVTCTGSSTRRGVPSAAGRASTCGMRRSSSNDAIASERSSHASSASSAPSMPPIEPRSQWPESFSGTATVPEPAGPGISVARLASTRTSLPRSVTFASPMKTPSSPLMGVVFPSSMRAHASSRTASRSRSVTSRTETSTERSGCDGLPSMRARSIRPARPDRSAHRRALAGSVRSRRSSITSPSSVAA